MNIPLLLTLVAAIAQAAPPPTPARKAAAAPANDALQIQVMLDRAGFSPGVIDGRGGSNTRKALAVYEKNGGKPDAAVAATTKYTITAEDGAGPFVPVPADMTEKSSLPALGYASLLEMLGERFHASPALLTKLNLGVTFAANAEITVPNVEPMVPPAPQPKEAARPQTAKSDAAAAEAPAAATPSAPAKPTAPAAPPSAAKGDVVVTVSKSASAATVTDASGKIILYAPVTTGSQHDPLPIGEWKVNGSQFNPTFHYNPDLFWDADEAHAKAKIPAGPNNPVGLVWIDISKEHYGLHGTPEPATVGKTESHGCVRLTNWDALRLAGLVKPGSRVIFKD